MKIMEILVKDAVILNLGVQTKREVLAEMAAALAKVEPHIEGDRLLEVLLERGCSTVQGMLLAPALAEPEVRRLLTDDTDPLDELHEKEA